LNFARYALSATVRFRIDPGRNNHLSKFKLHSIEQRALWLQWQNVAGLAWRQRRAHSVNLLIFLVALISVAFIAGKPTTLQALIGRLAAPAWLSNYSMYLGVLWLVYLSAMLHLRMRTARLSQAQDWLAALPIPAQARWQFVQFKAASVFAFELLAGALVLAWMGTWTSALVFFLFGALIGLLLLSTSPKVINPVVAAHTGLTQVKSGDLDRTPMQAWFFAALPTTVQMRWFWLLPMLLLPMAASFLYFCAVILGFAAYLRMAAISTAIGRAFLGMSALLHASPMPAAVLYRAGLRFALQALWPLLIIAGLLAWVLPAQLKLFGAGMVLLAGFLMIISRHHFSFGFRFLHAPQPGSHSERAAHARAWLVFLMVCGVLLRDLAPILPFFCLMAWRWLHQRGLAPVTGPKSSARNPR
jgi:hypothetical protein